MKEAYIEVFSSQGCVGCPTVKKMLKELSEELDGDITVEEVVEDVIDLAEEIVSEE